ncbi:MAG: CoA transferase [Acidimicrobiia bacterium]|nr:CoA transferase [Acidimicrobiia bacterium]
MSGLLDGVRVLAGPYAGQILAEMGADVIELEPPEGAPRLGARSMKQSRRQSATSQQPRLSSVWAARAYRTVRSTRCFR